MMMTKVTMIHVTKPLHMLAFPTTDKPWGDLQRRREQNRRSQKNYRQRKDSRISDLEMELRETTRQNELLEQQILALQRRNGTLSSASSPLLSPGSGSL